MTCNINLLFCNCVFSSCSDACEGGAGRHNWKHWAHDTQPQTEQDPDAPCKGNILTKPPQDQHYHECKSDGPKAFVSFSEPSEDDHGQTAGRGAGGGASGAGGARLVVQVLCLNPGTGQRGDRAQLILRTNHFLYWD